jgi:AraC-like DNA-binding protein
LLASEEYVARRFNSTNERITKVHEYLMSNFHEEVNLGKIAQLVHLAPGSLCRFFKSEMDMTIFDYLNKIKVDYACSLLLNRELGIVDIAYDCGFNNLSHFNKQFKKNMNSTPSQYRKQFGNILAG